MKPSMRISLIMVLLIALLPLASTQASQKNPSLSKSPDRTPDNTALLLDGDGDYLLIPHHEELNPASAISIEAWVNPDNISGCQTIVGKNFTQAYWLGLCSGRLRFYPHGSSSAVDGNATIPAGVWTHITLNNGKLVAIHQGYSITPPTNLSLLPGIGEITLEWDDTSDNETGFQVDYCLIEEACLKYSQVSANITKVTISQLPFGQAVRFRVRALGSFGGARLASDDQTKAVTAGSGYNSEYAYSAYTSVTPPAPQAPTGLSAAALSVESIEVEWNYAGLYADLLTGFNIFRSTSSIGTYEKIGFAGAASRSFVDTGLKTGKWYYYKVAAETTGGNSPRSFYGSARTRQQTLLAPTSLIAVQQDDLSIGLTWHDNATDETGYLVERRLPGTAEFVLTAMLPANTKAYNDPSALLAEGGIDYRVRAYTATKESLPATTFVTYKIPRDLVIYLPRVVR